MVCLLFCLRRLRCGCRCDVLRHLRSYWLRCSRCARLSHGCRTNHAANSGQNKYVLHNFLSKLLGRGIVGRLFERVNVSTVTANLFDFNVGTTWNYFRLVQFRFDKSRRPSEDKVQKSEIIAILAKTFAWDVVNTFRAVYAKNF